MNLNWIENLKKDNTSCEKVYITHPSKHGNGGWCGDSVLLETTLEKALRLTPKDIDDDFDYDETEFNNYDFYISSEPNSNKMIYKWNNYDCRWEKV